MASSIAMLNAVVGSVSYIAIPVDQSGTEISVSLKHPTLEGYYWKTTPGDIFNKVVTHTNSMGQVVYTAAVRVTFEMELRVSSERSHAPARIEQIAPAPVASDIFIDGNNVPVTEVDVFIYP